MSELKSCPFCNGRAIEVEDALSAKFGYPKSVKCSNCGASHINAEKWNQRPEFLKVIANNKENKQAEIDSLRARSKSIIINTCNVIGCKDCDLKWEGGCSSSELEGKITDLEMADYIKSTK